MLFSIPDKDTLPKKKTLEHTPLHLAKLPLCWSSMFPPVAQYIFHIDFSPPVPATLLPQDVNMTVQLQFLKMNSVPSQLLFWM